MLRAIKQSSTHIQVTADHLGTIGRMFILSRKMKRSTIRLKYLDSLRGGQRNRRYCAMLTEIVEVGERREENVCPV